MMGATPRCSFQRLSKYAGQSQRDVKFEIPEILEIF